MGKKKAEKDEAPPDENIEELKEAFITEKNEWKV
jgi:hypothetical protein